MKYSLILPSAVVCVSAASAQRPAPARVPLYETRYISSGRADIRPNENRTPAGTLKNGVLTVSLVARMGVWEPDGANGPGLPVAAFAEEGGKLSTPGPLLRVPVGTEIRATVRNSLDKAISLYGMGENRGYAGDSILLARGETRTVKFRVTQPGTYYYAGRTGEGPAFARIGEDSQLHGVILVENAAAMRRPADRVFVISNWFTISPTTVSGLGQNATLAINGRTWPYTERLSATVGDSLHYRVVNMTPLEHPMHLHGFYFETRAHGDGVTDTIYTPAQRRKAITELVLPGKTIAIKWVPERSGNWLFHCHFASHITSRGDLEKDRRMPAASAMHAGAHAQHNMEGLVLGIRVRPRGRTVVATGPARPIRLLIRSASKVYGDYLGYSFVLGGSKYEAMRDSLPLPGPTLVLKRNEPVAITLVNQAHEPAAVHWHGIELESFPDGVPGWSGENDKVLPMVPPGDSLTVRFTPPRAGTFMYHSHSNEFQQISSGLTGAIVVVDDPAMHNKSSDHVLLFSDGGPLINFFRPPPPTFLNGRENGDSLTFRAGVPQRLRLINIRTDFLMHVSIMDGDKPATWRIIAKDGADLPAHHSRPVAAKLMFAPGEIYDVEVIPAIGQKLELHHTVDSRPPLPTYKVPVAVR